MRSAPINEKLIRRILLAVALVIVGGLGLGVWLGYLSDGPPVDVSDLISKRVQIPDSENGFCVVMQAGPLIKADGKVLGLWHRDKDWDQKKVDALLADNREALALLDKALSLRGFQFKQADQHQRNLDVTAIYTLSEVKMLSAANHQNAGQYQAELEDGFKLLGLGRRVEDAGGSLLQFTIGLGIEFSALKYISDFTNNSSVTQDLKSAIARIEVFEDHVETFQNAARDEFVSTSQWINDLATGKMTFEKLGIELPAPAIAKWTFQPNNTRAMFAEVYRQVIREIPMVYGKIDRQPGMVKKFDSMSDKQLWMAKIRSGNALFFNLGSSTLSVFRMRHSITTRLAMIRTLMAVRCYWLDHGKLPAALDDLVPAYLKAVPLDAYDGKPLRYSQVNKLIYSVGTSLSDHGGDLSDKNEEGDKQPTVKIHW